MERRFAELKARNQGGLVAYISAGDPDPETSLAVLKRLPAAGAEIIELGVPFTDPMADGPAIQASGLRALKAGMSLAKTLDLVRRFREGDDATPIVLMGYYNPIYRYGAERFSHDAAAAGVDGLIIVDLPPEEDRELREPASAAGLDLIRLVAPTTDEARLPTVLRGAGGFIYYVSITGITGTASPKIESVTAAVERLKRFTDLPVAVGFGIRTPEQAGAIANVADAAVVGSALVQRIAANLGEDGLAGPGLVDDVVGFVAELAAGVRSGRG